MNLEQLSTMTDAELQAKANEHLERLDVPMVVSSGTETHKQHQIAQAQIFLAELDRRKQAKERIESEKIAARDYKLELWVIGLIGAELLLALVGIVVGWVEGSKQMDVLDKLNKSSAETAATLTTLQKEQEAALETQRHTLENIVTINDALQDEMDLNVTEAIQWGSAGVTQRVIKLSTLTIAGEPFSCFVEAKLEMSLEQSDSSQLFWPPAVPSRSISVAS
jgi:hypothetical protein